MDHSPSLGLVLRLSLKWVWNEAELLHSQSQARALLLGSSTIIICHVCINTRIEYKYINKVCIQYNLFI